MLKATITKINRNQNSPQVDVEVTYSDDEAGLNINRVFTMGFEEATVDNVTSLIQKSGEEYKTTLKNEDSLKNELEGKEINI